MRNKRLLLLVGVIALAVALGASWWFGAQQLPLTSSPISETTLPGRSGSFLPAVPVPSLSSVPDGSPSTEPGIAGTRTKGEVPHNVAEAIGRVTDGWRSVEEANTTLLTVMKNSESITAVAVVTEPTVGQIGSMASAVTSELEGFAPDSAEYRILRNGLDKVYAEYAQFASPKKIIVAMDHSRSNDPVFIEVTGGDENSVILSEPGKISITGDMQTTHGGTRYEHLFAKAAEEAAANE